jgi:hypothetical protein
LQLYSTLAGRFQPFIGIGFSPSAKSRGRNDNPFPGVAWFPEWRPSSVRWLDPPPPPNESGVRASTPDVLDGFRPALAIGGVAIEDMAARMSGDTDTAMEDLDAVVRQ